MNKLRYVRSVYYSRVYWRSHRKTHQPLTGSLNPSLTQSVQALEALSQFLWPCLLLLRSPAAHKRRVYLMFNKKAAQGWSMYLTATLLCRPQEAQ